MEGLFIIYSILLTIFFLVIAGGCTIYLLMGIGQLVIGYKEKDYVKKRAGWITTAIAGVILCFAIYYYVRLIFS